MVLQGLRLRVVAIENKGSAVPGRSPFIATGRVVSPYRYGVGGEGDQTADEEIESFGGSQAAWHVNKIAPHGRFVSAAIDGAAVAGVEWFIAGRNHLERYPVEKDLGPGDAQFGVFCADGLPTGLSLGRVIDINKQRGCMTNSRPW